MNGLLEKLAVLRPFNHLSELQRRQLLGAVQYASAGECLIRQDETERDYLLLLEGELEVRRRWITMAANDEVQVGWIQAGQDGNGLGFLSSLPRRATVTAATDARYIRIDGQLLEELMAWSQRLAGQLKIDSQTRHRMSLVRYARSFLRLPLSEIHHAFERMDTLSVAVGMEVLTEGARADRFYIIEAGNAEVSRVDPATGKSHQIAMLQVGDALGEEALWLGGYHHATVTMRSQGTLLSLEANAFEQLLKPGNEKEIQAQAAKTMVDQCNAQWLDCRYAAEYEESRIPGAQLLPLNKIIQRISRLDRNQTYIVYCCTGRRSACAAMLLREHHVNAMSLQGGMRDWPYAVEGFLV